MMFARFAKGILWMLATLLSSGAMAGDWPHYRGPTHDGISTDIIRTNWDAEPPQVIWRKPLSPALSSFAVTGGKAYTQGRRTVNSTQREFCIALNADTGVELWAANLDTATYSGGYGDGSDDGPRSTPSVDGNRVYVLTSYLKLFCLNAVNGQVVWSNNLVANFGASVISWQNAASPLLAGDVVMVNCNGRANEHLIGFRKTDGAVLWKVGSDGMTQASPVLATIGGVEQAIFFAQSGLVSVAATSGQVLWRFPVSYNSTSTAASPVVAGDLVYCSQNYTRGAVLARITNSGGLFTASEVWPMINYQRQNHWCTPVHYSGRLFGIYGSGSTTLRCLDLLPGTNKWSTVTTSTGKPYDFGSAVVIDNKILAVTGDNTDPVGSCTNGGLMVLIDPTSAAYHEIARFRALTGRCWNVPAVSAGRIYLRSSLEGVCVDVSYPRLKLQPAISAGDGRFRLDIANESGKPLDAARASIIQVFASDTLSTNTAGWVPSTNKLVLINGVLRMEDAAGPNPPRRFYEVREQP